MVRSKLAAALVCAALLAPLAAVQAQQAPVTAPPPVPIISTSVASYTPEQDLRCAAVVAMVASQIPEAQRVGAAAGLSYFLGRYEAATGKRYEDALTPGYMMATAAKMGDYNVECGERMKSFGVRMQAWGQTLKDADKPAG